MGHDKTDRFRGGKKAKRDTWYGLERLEDFERFRDWWHREGKFTHDADYIKDGPKALEVYQEWDDLGRP